MFSQWHYAMLHPNPGMNVACNAEADLDSDYGVCLVYEVKRDERSYFPKVRMVLAEVMATCTG